MSTNSIIICEECGGETPKRSAVQKYCLICSAKIDVKRKSKWAVANPLSETKKQRRVETKIQREALKKQEAALISEEARQPIAWPAEENPDLIWLVRIATPFSYGFSKNAQWAMGNRAHVFLRQKATRLRNALKVRIKNAMVGADFKVVSAKVWIDIFVQKSNHRGDAINVVDAVCDALKDAIGLDDRWFSLRRLDWQVVKENPMIYIGFGQTTDVPQSLCSYCGIIKASEEHFGKRKHTNSGYATVCRDCSRIDGAVKRSHKKLTTHSGLQGLL